MILFAAGRDATVHWESHPRFDRLCCGGRWTCLQVALVATMLDLLLVICFCDLSAVQNKGSSFTVPKVG